MRQLAAPLVALCLAAWPAATLGARQDVTRGDATTMEQKLLGVLARGSVASDTGRTPIRTSFTEREVNSFFQFSELLHLPVGVKEPRLTIADGGRLEGRAVVDLDAVRKSQERGVLDPLSYVSGAVQIAARGTLRTANGQGVLDLQSATLNGIAIPKSLLQELVTYYSRTPETPSGFDLDKPFVLPAAIRAVEFRQGAATIIQ